MKTALSTRNGQLVWCIDGQEYTAASGMSWSVAGNQVLPQPDRAALDNRMGLALHVHDVLEWEVECGEILRLSARARTQTPFGPRPIDRVGVRLPLPGAARVLVRDLLYQAETPIGIRIPFDQASGLQQIRLFMVEMEGKWLQFSTRCRNNDYWPVGEIVRTREGFVIDWQWQPPAPFPCAWETPDLEIRLFSTLEAAAAEYHDWLAQGERFVPLKEHPHVPSWLPDCRFISHLDCTLTDGTILHDFAKCAQIVRKLGEAGAPPDSVLYITGWEGAYCVNWPDLWPSDCLGGEPAFRELLASAKDAGFRVLLHVGMYLMDLWNPDLAYLRPFSLVDGYGREYYWPYTRNNPDYRHSLLWLDLCAPEVQADFLCRMRKLIDAFQPDGLFLDTFSTDGVSNANTPRGDFAGASRQLVEILYAEYPELALGGEHPSERVGNILPLMNVPPYPYDVVPVEGWDGTTDRPGDLPSWVERDFRMLTGVYGGFFYIMPHIEMTPCGFQRAPHGPPAPPPEKFDRCLEYHARRGTIPGVRTTLFAGELDEGTKQVLATLEMT